MIAIPDDAIVIGFGGNVGGQAAIVERFVRAREALANLGDVRSAPLYRTAPIGPAQEPFFNTAVRMRWPDAVPSEVIATVLELERLLGRDRRGALRWGPRAIDLDLLLYDDRTIDEPGFTVPHPLLHERLFVLEPLAELAPDLVVPGRGRVAELLAEIQSSS